MASKNTAMLLQAPQAASSGYRPGRADAGRAENACRELQVAGVEPLLLRQVGEVCASGVALSVSAATILGSEAAAAQLRHRAFTLLASGIPIAVAVTGLGRGRIACESFRRLCEVLRSAMQDACAKPGAVEIAIEIEALTPQAAWLIRREICGTGPVHVIADGAWMNMAGARSTGKLRDQFWLQLWHLRDASSVRAGYATLASSRCPLLSAELVASVLPSIGMQIPAGTAWVPMRLDLVRFTDARGSVQEAALERALHSCVDMGEVLHDAVHWPTATMRHDAWLNRRLAIVVTGLGDLASRQKLDPLRFNSLHNLNELLLWVQKTLQARSCHIARQTSCAPALELCDPSRTLPGGHTRDAWQQRWRAAVNHGAVRHRNLMALSPWSVFPTRFAADMRYADLLPLIGLADVCAFDRPMSLAHWNVNQFKKFHQRAWAVLQQKDAAALTAAPV